MNEQFFEIQLEDYSIPEILPFPKKYYGTLNQVGELIKHPSPFILSLLHRECFIADVDHTAAFFIGKTIVIIAVILELV